MPDKVIGELSKFTLFDLVQPLLHRKNSGMVLVRGSENGELYIEAGNIVHARTRDAVGDDAVLAMIGWDKGAVIFDWESTTDERTVNLPTEQMMEGWSRRERQWRRIRGLVPSGDAVFRICVATSEEDRHIPGDQWRILTLSNGSRSVAEVARITGWDLLRVSNIICEMVENGLLERAEELNATPPSAVNGNFFATIELELKKALGPIAPFVVDDTVADFGESRNAFPRERVHEFVRAISDVIPDAVKKEEFELRILEVFLIEINQRVLQEV